MRTGLRTTRGAAHAAGRVAMLLENQPYPQDVRVRSEAEALTRAGWQVTVLAPRAAGERRREVVERVEVRRYWLPVAGSSKRALLGEYAIAHLQLLRLTAGQLLRGTRVVHLHNPPDTLFPLGLLARAVGGRAVYDHHDLVPELLEAKFAGSRLVGFARWAQRRALRAAGTILVTNDSQREIAVRRGGVPAERIFVVRNGPPLRTLAASPAGREGPLTVPRLVYLGELAEQDGVLALPELLLESPLRSARLTVVGDGPCRRDLELRIARHPGLADRVRFTGRVSHEHVPAELRRADLAIDVAGCSTLNHHSTMVKVGEYLAAGLPLVAYDLVETRRTARDAALYAPCGDRATFAALVGRLALDAEQRAKLGRQALARAGELVWERSEGRLLDAYGELVPSVAR